jgi:tRNA(Ser,Leu) C12 N-acetylase TAN1
MEWNVLATSFEGLRPALQGGLKRFGKFGGGGYRNVLIGRVADRQVFFDELREAYATDERLKATLAKVVPIDTVVRFDLGDPLEKFGPVLDALVPRMPDGTFFVRINRRGLKGHLDTIATERQLGDHLWKALAAAGRTPSVSFKDAEAIVLIEMLGTEAGVGLISRSMRVEYPFVRAR